MIAVLKILGLELISIHLFLPGSMFS